MDSKIIKYEEREKTEIEKAISSIAEVEYHEKEDDPVFLTEHDRQLFEEYKERDLQNLKSEILDVAKEIIDATTYETAPCMQDLLKKLKWFIGVVR